MHHQAQSAQELTAKVREAALRLGFFKVGIARPALLPHPERFQRWLELGMQGQMAYMERQATKRKDPASILPELRSIVVLAMNYHSVQPAVTDRLQGRISCYAWGDDYHTIITGRLAQLRECIAQIAPGSRAVGYVDTGPVMEKVWGSETSLGWTGKHSNLITREQGSWLFLGVLLLDLELQYDSKLKDYCGTCTRCMSACPTEAIVAPYVVDARLCISYLTIELRGSIPRNLRSAIGNRILGCDDCQQVCPWNRFAIKSAEPGFFPRDGFPMPWLASLVQITPEEFKVRYKNSPVLRAKRDGFVRNVAVALGNSGRPEAEAPLSIAMRDASALVRAHAAWGLGQLRSQSALRVLQQALVRETYPEVREEIRLALEAQNV